MSNICKWCGNEFENPYNRKKACCSKSCANKHNWQLHKWRREKEKRDKQTAIERQGALSRLQQEARAAGMSYGQYVARLEGGMK